MKELSMQEVENVSGGDFNDWQNGGLAVMGLSLYSPVTAAFGLPIGGAMFALGSFYSYW
ncbi:hypothetical protein [Alkalimarinus coralli]|uniref:hypothetical protein n=1 Tax=Alkalimarinus coralli TaxID=2935863 RepID=UPI00202B274B|nr:hypothetical protein [Alkalimarinus coralli]